MAKHYDKQKPRGGWPPGSGWLAFRTALHQSKEYSEEVAVTTATVTSKGQITIPAEVRAALQVEAGDRVEFVEIEPGRFEVVAANHSVRELKGLFRRPAKAVTIEEMNKAIAARGAAAR